MDFEKNYQISILGYLEWQDDIIIPFKMQRI